MTQFFYNGLASCNSKPKMVLCTTREVPKALKQLLRNSDYYKALLHSIQKTIEEIFFYYR